MSTKNNTPQICESPDGGRTVYARQFGTVERVLIWEDNEAALNRRLSKWHDIIILAEKEPSLNDLLSKAEVLYEILKKENQ